MKKSEAIAFYDNNVSALARAVSVDQSTIYSWGEYPPDKHQLRIERLTKKKLRAEPGCKERLLGLDINTPEPAKAGA